MCLPFDPFFSLSPLSPFDIFITFYNEPKKNPFPRNLLGDAIQEDFVREYAWIPKGVTEVSSIKIIFFVVRRVFNLFHSNEKSTPKIKVTESFSEKLKVKMKTNFADKCSTFVFYSNADTILS